MKRTLFIFSLCLLTLQGYCQPSADYLGIGGGAGIPVGKFAATNSPYYNQAGFATTGGSFNINYIHKFNDWVGLAVTYFDVENSVNGDKILDISGENNMDVRRNSNANCLLVGGYLKKTDFPIYAKAQIGFGAVQTAELRFYDNQGPTTLEQSDPVYGFAYSVGVGAFLPLSYRWALTLSVDYVSCIAKPTVTSVDYTGATQGPAFSYNQSFINGQVGIGYMFGPRYHRQRQQHARQIQNNNRGDY